MVYAFSKNLQKIFSLLTEKKKQLDAYRPLSKELSDNLENWFRVELTYTSNALEGNTLSRKQTALIVEKGLTIGGKSFLEHIEATNHTNALYWIEKQAQRDPKSLEEKDILEMHSLILQGIDTKNAGRYRNVSVRISGSLVICPNPQKVPDHMKEFASWLQEKREEHPVFFAAQAHYQLVTIHPFTDGNGRTARLLMNLLLLMQGYPPAIIRKRDRLAYLEALEKAQLGGEKEEYFILIAKAVERSLTIYLDAIEQKKTDTFSSKKKNLLKIGELSKKTKETQATIRYWTKEGLLPFSAKTDSGYFLYGPESLDRITRIHALKEKRRRISEIKEILAKEFSTIPEDS